MSIADLYPHWPVGFDAWEGFIVLVALGLFKFYRGTTLKRRSEHVDRFGWSIIIFDWTFAVVFGVSIAFNLYPELRTHHVSRVLLGLLLAVTIWQTLEVARAQPHRVREAMGGRNGIVPEPTYPEIDRRNGEPGRRADDYAVRGLDAGPGQERR